MANQQGASASSSETTPNKQSCSATSTSTDHDTASEGSELSAYSSSQYPIRAIDSTHVFQQATRRDDFKRLAMANVPMDEAYPGAQDNVSNLNPEYFKLAKGTHVINIKTNIAANLYCAIRHGKWATLEKVCKRIMTVWDARTHPNDKILFLVALNGHKVFRALAEMSGPWDPADSIEGWEEGLQGAASVGAIPLTWHFVKDVPYEAFSNVYQKRDKQPVLNMWNGMHIEPETAREVVEIYAKAPHETNILAWPKRHSPHGAQLHGGRRQVPNIRALREPNQRGGSTYAARRNVPAALTVANWRQPLQQTGQLPSPGVAQGPVANKTPAANEPSQRSQNITSLAQSPGFDGSHESGVAHCPGQMYIVGEDNNLLPVTPNSATSMTFPSPQQQFMYANAQMYASQGSHGYGMSPNGYGHAPFSYGAGPPGYGPGSQGYGATLQSHGIQRAMFGGARGGAQSGAHGDRDGSALRGAKSSQDMRRDQTPTRFGLGISPGPSDGSNLTKKASPHHLRHAASAATFVSTSTQSPAGNKSTPKMPTPNVPPHTTVVQDDSTASNVVGPVHQSRPQHSTIPAGKAASQANHSFDIRQAANATEFIPRSQDPDALFPCKGSYNPKQATRSETLGEAKVNDNHAGVWRLVGVDIHGERRYEPLREDDSDFEDTLSYARSSDLSYFKTANSMAGFTPRGGKPPHVKLDFRILDKSKMIREWAHDSDFSSDLPPHARVWEQFPPANPVRLPSSGGLSQQAPGAREEDQGADMERKKKTIFYNLMSEKEAVSDQLADPKAKDNMVQYYKLKAQQSEVDDMICRLMQDSGNESREEGHASVAAFSTSSVQRFNISPVRRADGQPMFSASMQGSPPRRVRSKRGDQSRKNPFESSWAAGAVKEGKRNKKALVGEKRTVSPTSSIDVQAHSTPSSPQASGSPAEPTTARKVSFSGPKSDDVHDSDDDADEWSTDSGSSSSSSGGGIRLDA